jgi:hypothetical protein
MTETKMEGKQPSLFSSSGAAIPGGVRERAASAMNALLKGYQEEAQLYLRMLRLTWQQRDILRSALDVHRFRDLLEEKEDLLRLIAQIEFEMKDARSFVLSQPPSGCPNRWKLEMLLDRLTEMIEEIRVVEGNNACLLQTIPVAS